MKSDLATRLKGNHMVTSRPGSGSQQVQQVTNLSLHVRLGITEEEAQSGEQNTQQLAKCRTAKDKRSQLGKQWGGGVRGKQ